MSKTKIEWTDKTWNPVTGCTKISEGCKNCYAETMANRLQKMDSPKYKNGFKVTCHPDTLGEPLKWKKGVKIFVCSMADLFHEDVPFEFIDKVFAVMALCPQHTFQILTKRPDRMREYMDLSTDNRAESIGAGLRELTVGMRSGLIDLPLPNVWLGVTAENQEQADKRIPILLQIPAVVRFVSIEPMVGAVDLTKYWDNVGGMPPARKIGETNTYVASLDWVILGGESGANARPMHPDWVRKVKGDCKEAGVPFFFKQWGEWKAFYDRDRDDPNWDNVPEESSNIKRLNLAGGQGFHGKRVIYFKRIGKKKAGSLLDGEEHKEFPE